MGGEKQKLKVNPNNPRKITPSKTNQLFRSMAEYGDISGIVFNTRTGHLVGGNQRSGDLDETSKVVITERFEKPTRVGTVAIGYILHKGEHFSYREVDWPVTKETGAMIAANKNAGTWDETKLREHLEHLGSFDVDFDLDLTMFEPEELLGYLENGQSVSSKTPTTEETGLPESPSKLVHECPRCGYAFR